MLTVAEAWEAIEGVVSALPRQRVPLAEALGLVLAENAIADLDSPPFDKALMDGYAVRFADMSPNAGMNAELRVTGESRAGTPFDGSIAKGQAVRIFTGAMMPAGTDHVLIQEDCIREGDHVAHGVIAHRPAVAGGELPSAADHARNIIAL